MSVLTVCISTIHHSVVFVLMTHHFQIHIHLNAREVVVDTNQRCATRQVIELKTFDQEVCAEPFKSYSVHRSLFSFTQQAGKYTSIYIKSSIKISDLSVFLWGFPEY